jgi:hypothetical protein
MSLEPINTAPIQQFIQQVKSAEASRTKELRMSIDQCKNLALTLGIVMARLNGDLEKFVKENAGSSNETIEIKMDSGANWG